ncbi:zf-HC2 domain-containing protein [Nocardia sp. BMG51109]|uniref:zf-HC2 domain-containing protein n=1 Tax=Nocardia sp. BMG51109 TaxID=1056816 RepID=UPI000464742F|nr:zf-HC2 domain-containing protein [Nocardia sp. BMG51109]
MGGEDAAASRESGTAAGRGPGAAAGRGPGRPARFAPTEHLASEAIAAYVDGELRMNAYLRAAEHLAKCPECAAEVDAQQQARIALRRAAQRQISAPGALTDSLSRIPLANLPGAMDEMTRGSSFPDPRGDSFRFVSTDREFSPESRRWTGWWRK